MSAPREWRCGQFVWVWVVSAGLAGGGASELLAQDPTQPDVDLRADCARVVGAEAGQTVRLPIDVFLTTRRNPPPAKGVQGWSLSLASSGGLNIVSATTDGTAGAPAPAGLRGMGFEKTELTSGTGNAGVVSAVVLSFTEGTTLPSEGEAKLLAVLAEVTAPAEGCLQVALEFKDELKGSGQPVFNRVTIGGSSHADDGGDRDNDADGSEPCRVQVCVGSGFQRANCDGVGSINLSDAIFALNHLFLGGRVPPCRKACDANDDNAFNLTDPIYTLNYLFLGGKPPRAPFPDCGADQTPDALDCLATPPSCAGA